MEVPTGGTRAGRQSRIAHPGTIATASRARHALDIYVTPRWRPSSRLITFVATLRRRPATRQRPAETAEVTAFAVATTSSCGPSRSADALAPVLLSFINAARIFDRSTVFRTIEAARSAGSGRRRLRHVSASAITSCTSVAGARRDDARLTSTSGGRRSCGTR